MPGTGLFRNQTQAAGPAPGSPVLLAYRYNASMLYLRNRSFFLMAAALGLVVSLSLSAQDSGHRGRKYKAPAPTSRVDVTILRNDDGKPIENAAVVFQLEGEKGNMELKTDEDGKTMIDVLPTGSKVLVQVIAKGFQTFGGDYQIDKPEMAIQLKLKRPGQQYSIYDNHPGAAKSQGSGNTAKPDSKQGSGAKDTSKDQSSNQSNAKPDSSQPQ